MTEQLKTFVKHPGINKAWLSIQIYGDSTSKNRKKISLRLSGQSQWQDWELEKLKEIKEQLKKTL